MSDRRALSGWSAVRVVARRELRERLRDRATQIGTAVIAILIVAIVLVPKLLGIGATPTVKVAAAPGAATALAESARAAQEPFDVKVQIVRVADDRAGRALVADRKADVVVLDGGRALGAKSGADGLPLLQATSQRARAEGALQRAGVGGSQARAVLDPPPLPVHRVGAENAAGLAFVVLMLMYTQLLMLGMAVAMGVVEEKASRIVEILLAAIKPRDLLTGKVLGLGSVGLLQMLFYGAIGLIVAAATGQLDVGGPGALGAVLIALGWFVLGYFLYAALFAAAGAIVSRQEELQNATGPITIILIAVFIASFQALDNPSSTVVQVLSYVPFSAPMVMPVRLVQGGVGAGEIILSVAATVAGILIVLAFAGRIYGNAVLRTGSRTSWRAALSGGTR